MDRTQDTNREGKMNWWRRCAGFAHENIGDGGHGFWVASVGAHPNVAKHMTPTRQAEWGPYRELARFPGTRGGKVACIAFCDDYNIRHFPEFAAAARA